MATIKKACKGTSYPKSSNVSKRLGSPSKAKKGGSFDLNKDGKTTFKDVLIGRGVLPKTAKKGMKVKKAQSGESLPDNPLPKYQTSGKTKTKTYSSSDGSSKRDYVTINKTNVGSGGKSVVTKSKVRRTVGGLLRGVPKVQKMGGKTKKCMYGCK